MLDCVGAGGAAASRRAQPASCGARKGGSTCRTTLSSLIAALFFSSNFFVGQELIFGSSRAMSVLTRSLTHAQVISAAGHRFHLVQPLLAQLATSSCSRGRSTPTSLRSDPLRRGPRADAQGPNARHGAGRFLGSSRGAPPTSWPVSKHQALGARCAQTLMPMPCASSV